MRRPVWLIVALVALGLWLLVQSRPPAPAPSEPATASASSNAGAPIAAPTRADTNSDAEAARPAAGYPAFLPPEAHEVLQRIASGGPFPHRQDGSVFQNRERRLPAQPRGYYHEYTVETPGSSDRGARRIITGGTPPQDYWYTDDHYRHFQHFEVSP